MLPKKIETARAYAESAALYVQGRILKRSLLAKKLLFLVMLKLRCFNLPFCFCSEMVETEPYT